MDYSGWNPSPFLKFESNHKLSLLNTLYTCAIFCLSLTFQRWRWWPVWEPVSAGLEAAGQPWPPGWGRRVLTAAKLPWRIAAEAPGPRGTPGAGWRRPCRTGMRRPWASLWRTKEQKVSEGGDLWRLSVDRLIRLSRISVCVDCQAERVHICLAVMWLTLTGGLRVRMDLRWLLMSPVSRLKSPRMGTY